MAPGGQTQYGSYELDLQKPPILLQLGATEPYKGIGTVRFSFLRPDQYLDEGEFIRNDEAQYSLEETWNEKEEDGFDIYIDAVHNLPDNCAIVKVRA